MFSRACGETTAERIDLVTGELKAGAVWCKSWYCEHCYPIRLKQLQAQACDGEPTKFITLTSAFRPGEMTTDEAAQELVHAWRMVVQRAKRERIWTEVQYIAVFEITEQGWPHLHILARCNYVAQKWLSDRMAEYAHSPIVDIRAVRGKARAAWYVAKYMSKAPERFQGCKRYWRTHGYDQSEGKRDKPLHDHFQGYFHRMKPEVLAASYQAYGYQVEWHGERSFVAWPDGLDLNAKLRENYWLKHPHPKPGGKP